MATLDLRLDLPANFTDQFVATWDVVNADLEVVARGSLLDERADRATLPSPGKYWARMQLPNGQTQTRAVTVAAEDANVEALFRYQAPRGQDWPTWAALAEAEKRVTSPGDSPLADTDVHVQCWAYEKQQWSMTSDAASATLEKTNGIYQLGLQVDAPRLIGLQVGGSQIASRFVLLPPTGLSRILLIPGTASGQTVVGSIEISVSLANSVADHLARFLTVASPSGRESLDEKLALAEGRELLAEKRNDPLGAAVGGYFLVSDSSREPPMEWFRRLSDMVEWLADGPIIYAYAALKYRRRDAVDDAMRFLGIAAGRGYPVFRRGIELYLDACRMLESSGCPLSPDVEAAAARFAQVRAADTRQTAFTTFFGIHPGHPQVQRVVSRPLAPRAAASDDVQEQAEADLFSGVQSRML